MPRYNIKAVTENGQQIEVWLSLVERFVRDEEVACSNHVIPILQGFQYGYVSKSLAGAGEPV